MQEIFDKIRLEKFEDLIVTLRNQGKNEDADKLAYLIAPLRYRQSLGR